MPVLTPTEVYDAAQTVLTSIETAATALSATLPDRRFVNTGGTVYDCESVAVTLVSSTTGLVDPTGEHPGTAFNPRGPVWQLTLGLAIVRCAAERPTGRRGDGIPDVADIEQDASASSQDAAILIQAVDSLLGDDAQAGVNLEVTFNQTEGGLFAVTANLTYNPWLVP